MFPDCKIQCATHLPIPRSFLGVGVDGRPNLATVFDNCSAGCGTFEDEEGKGPSNNSSSGASATSLSGASWRCALPPFPTTASPMLDSSELSVIGPSCAFFRGRRFLHCSFQVMSVSNNPARQWTAEETYRQLLGRNLRNSVGSYPQFGSNLQSSDKYGDFKTSL